MKKNRDFRHATLELFKYYGIGPGTMLNFKPSRYESEKILIIEDVKWENIRYQHGGEALIVNEFGERNHYYDIAVSEAFFHKIESGNITILKPTSPNFIGVALPNDWLNGKLGIIDKAFGW